MVRHRRVSATCGAAISRTSGALKQNSQFRSAPVQYLQQPPPQRQQALAHMSRFIGLSYEVIHGQERINLLICKPQPWQLTRRTVRFAGGALDSVALAEGIPLHRHSHSVAQEFDVPLGGRLGNFQMLKDVLHWHAPTSLDERRQGVQPIRFGDRVSLHGKLLKSRGLLRLVACRLTHNLREKYTPAVLIPCPSADQPNPQSAELAQGTSLGMRDVV